MNLYETMKLLAAKIFYKNLYKHIIIRFRRPKQVNNKGGEGGRERERESESESENISLTGFRFHHALRSLNYGNPQKKKSKQKASPTVDGCKNRTSSSPVIIPWWSQCFMVTNSCHGGVQSTMAPA